MKRAYTSRLPDYYRDDLRKKETLHKMKLCKVGVWLYMLMLHYFRLYLEARTQTIPVIVRLVYARFAR